jgi:hypothetical protein
VFLIPEDDGEKERKTAAVYDNCREVLQKPTEQVMRAKEEMVRTCE